MPHRFVNAPRASLIPLLATILGLVLGLALHQASGAVAAGNPGAADPLPPLVHRTVTPRSQEAGVSRAGSAVVRPSPPPVPPQPAPPPPPPPPAPPPKRQSRAFAGLTNLTLNLPHGVRAIGFHESGDRRAQPLHPMGIPRTNDNMPRLMQAPVGDGFEYLVLRTRGRVNAPTSAVDLSIPENVPITSPVTGTVVDAKAYLLYRQVPDNMIFVVPDARQDLLVVLMHVNGLQVNVGDRVEAGRTVLALSSRQLPFGSQIDRYAGRRPHVHIEVRRR